MLYIPDMSEKTDSSATVSGQRVLPYGAFYAFLIVYTLLEVLVFTNRDQWALSNDTVVPILLTLTLIKFILVVGWFLYSGHEARWFAKVMLVALVVGGATGLIVYLLFNPLMV